MLNKIRLVAASPASVSTSKAYLIINRWLSVKTMNNQMNNQQRDD
jgi:hypothetical protein